MAKKSPFLHERDDFAGLRDNLDIASNDAFVLSDSATRILFEAEYLKTAALYFKGQFH